MKIINIIPLLVAPLILWVSLKFCTAIKLYDFPDNQRKIHLKPTLLAGGIFFYLIITLSYFYYFIFPENQTFSNYSKDHFIFLGTLTIIFLIGIYDDKKNLTPFTKLFLIFFVLVISLILTESIFHIKILIFSKGYQLNLYSYSIAFTALCFVILLNSVNMSDGINSLSSLIFIFWLIILTFFLKDNNFYYCMNIILIFSLIIFSFLNYNNKCFMGDSGCFVLSTYISYVTVFVYNNNLINFDKTLNVESLFLLFSLPGIDMTRLFVQRLINSQNPLKPDKNHFHHYLIKRFNLRKALLIYSFLLVSPWAIYLSNKLLLGYLIFTQITLYGLIILKLSNSK